VAAFAALAGFLFLNTLYLQEVRGLSAIRAGLYTLPMAVMSMVCAPIAGRIVGRRGTRIPLVAAGIGLTAGSVLLTRMSPTTPFSTLAAAYIIFGIGFGLVNAPVTNTAVSGMPRAQAGVAAAIASASRQIGSSLGVAIVGAVAAQSGALGASFAHATHPAWWFVTGCRPPRAPPRRSRRNRPCRRCGPANVRRCGHDHISERPL
jgi:MFS family permease